MELKEIAEELVAGCRENRAKENLGRLYAEDAVSVEAVDNKGMGARRRGLMRSAASMTGGRMPRR